MMIQNVNGTNVIEEFLDRLSYGALFDFLEVAEFLHEPVIRFPQNRRYHDQILKSSVILFDFFLDFLEPTSS